MKFVHQLNIYILLVNKFNNSSAIYQNLKVAAVHKSFPPLKIATLV